MLRYILTDSRNFRFKVIVIGDGSVGKTSLIQKFTQGTFQKEYIKTIGAQFSKFDAEIDDDTIRLIFWDIAGQDDFLFLRPTFYRESNAAIIVYTLENNNLGRRSFNHIKDWHEEVKKNLHGDIPVVIFANKVDLIDNNKFDETEVQKLVEDRNFLGFYLTSAKTGEGVHDAFHVLIQKLYARNKALASEV